MTIPTVSLSEASPAGTDNIALGDNRIREYKTQNREILEVNHDYPTSGQSATAGQHKKVTLQEQADLGTGAVGATILGSQTVSTKGELVYTDEDDNDVQLTSGGKLCTTSLTTVASISTIMNLIYPVGSQYVNYTVSTNPATLLGIGTWVAVTEKVTVGIGGSGIFSTLTTGGAKTVDSSHVHNVPAQSSTAWGNSGTFASSGRLAAANVGGGDGAAPEVSSDVNTGSGGSTTLSIVQEFRTAYVWERTA